MASIGKRKVRTSLIEWWSGDAPPFSARLNEALDYLHERGASVIYIDHRQSLAGVAPRSVLRSALIVYEEEPS